LDDGRVVFFGRGPRLRQGRRSRSGTGGGQRRNLGRGGAL